MTVDNLVDRIAAYLSGNVASHVQSYVTRFAIGAAASESGKRMMSAKLAPFIASIADEKGEFSAETLKDFIVSGMKVAGTVPILGGLVTLDERDAEKFCESL